MSHKKFGPDRFSRFDVYWIQTNKQTNRQTDTKTDKPNLYIDRVVISVRLFVCPIITQEPLERFALNFDKGILESHGNVLSFVLF